MRLVSLLTFASALALASAANAMIAPFGGAASGVDPLGNSWVTANTSGPAWGEPGLGLGTEIFNTANNSAVTGNTWANRFSFIFLEGVSGSVKMSLTNTGFTDTRFYDVTTGQYWLKTYVGANKVVFTAPFAGAKISKGDSFFVNVDFTGPVNLKKFSFAGLWTDDAYPIPEPTTWALMIGGFGLAGMALRRRRTLAA
jgi:hypothetical protein